MKFILTSLYVLFTTLGLTLFKLGGGNFSVALKNGFSFKIGYFTLIGFLCYGLSFLLWQKVLSMFELSYIVPITTGIVQVIILIIAIIFFKENISIQSLIGIILIIVGVILLSLKK